MRYEDILRVLGDIAAADSLSYAIVGTLTLLVFVVMRAMLPVKGLAVVFAPAIFWGGLTGIYAASSWGLLVSKDKAANIAATATPGMIAALVVMVVLARLVDIATRVRAPLDGHAPAPAPRRVRI